MVQQNMLYTGPILDSEHQQEHPPHGGVPCFPQPYRTMLPPPGNGGSFDPRYLPENHGFLQYVVGQYSEHCNSFMVPPPSAGVFSVLGFHNGHMIHVGQPTPTPTPLLDQHSATGAFSWNHAHGGPYLQGSMNGGGMEAANIGIRGYQVAAMSRNSSAFMHPPHMPLRCRHTLYHPPPPPPPPMSLVAQNMDPHMHLASTSYRHPISTPTANPFQNGVDLAASRFVGYTPNGLRIYEAPQRDMVIEPPPRQRSSPHLRVLLEDEHLAQGEQNSDGGRDWEGFIIENLKTKTFISSKSSNPTAAEEEHHFCVICQADIEDEEEMGVIECCHEYHAECIRKWLVIKNACPICKETAIHICKDTMVLDI